MASHHVAALAVLVVALCACRSDSGPGPDSPEPANEARRFLEDYNRQYRELSTAASEAEWTSNIRIVEGDDSNAKRTQAAKEKLAAFTGSEANITASRRFLGHRERLDPVDVRQLETILYEAGNNPATVAALVKERIAAETIQTEKLFGFTFRLGSEEITPNRIDEILKSETDLAKRLGTWEASKEVGRELGAGLENLRRLRNATVRALGFPDFFAYQVSEYGMDTREMMSLLERINAEVRPLYRELHTWMRHELARRLGQPVPDLIPAHWLPNRWSQDWSAAVDVAGFDLDRSLREKPAEWVVRQAERFYVSLGFDPLPVSFWERSSLFPLPPGSPFKKNNHASAWHLDLDHDVRCLMSVEPNSEWFETAHHELGHIYYYRCYSRPEVPPILRRGANRAFHEAVGSQLGLAAMQPRFCEAVGVVPGGAAPDPVRLLLKEALNFIVFIPWSAGVMTGFEHDLYAQELARPEWNARWWELVRRWQGVVPPAPRGGDLCDPATKTHVNDDAAQYYDYALSFVLLFQLHDHVAREILKEDPRDTNYYGRVEVGAFLRRLLAPGATADWRRLLRDATGSDLSATPMLRYFDPLMSWLREQNSGRVCTLE